MSKSNIPSVLAFEKKLVPSDGFMCETTWESRTDSKSATPLKLIEKSVRGTISNRLKKEQANDVTKINQQVEKPNLQKVDNCALSMEKDTLKLEFTLKVLSGLEKPSACNNADFAKSYAEAVGKYKQNEGFKELGKRYATNLANARFLWRNRIGAEKIEVIIEELTSEGAGSKWQFTDAKKFGLKDFEHNDKDILELGQKISGALSGDIPYLLLKITAFAKVGKAQEVYPSEELVLDKANDNKKSKILYQVDDVAAMHSQKIGNAIRTIDSWHPSFAEVGLIAIEPYGAVTNAGKAYRVPKENTDFFSLFDKYALGEPLAKKEDEHYVMAILIRGGVFGQSGKE